MHRIRLIILASVAVGALLGLAALLGAEFGEVQGKITVTSFSITGAGLFVLAAVSASPGLGIIRPAGAAGAVGGFTMFVVGIWAEPAATVYWKATGTLLIVAAAAGLLGILSHVVLASHQRWVGTAADLLTGLVAVYSVLLMWTEPEAQWAWRLFGASGVLLATAAVAVLVLHGGEATPAAGGIAIRFCPFCGAGVAGTVGAATGCPSCGRAFVVGPAG